MSTERDRMRDPGRPEEGLDTASPWYQWGPYVSERAWGSSAGANHDWSDEMTEAGTAGVERQRLGAWWWGK